MVRLLPRLSCFGEKPVLNYQDQPTVATMVGVCLLAILGRWGCHALRGSAPIRFDRAEPLQIDFQVPINSADWPEFALLPGIGQTLAERIVEYRQQHGPFASVEHVERVKGIGPKTMQRIRPMLRVD